MDLTPLEPRTAPVAFDLAFGADPWFTAERRRLIEDAFLQWAVLVVGERVVTVEVSTGPLSNVGALAEAGLATETAGVVRFNPVTLTDTLLPSVALHEAGHLVGLDHQPADTATEWRTVMHPYADASRTTLTGLEARDLVWAGHEVPAGTVLAGIGTTPGGWMVYGPPPADEFGWPRGHRLESE